MLSHENRIMSTTRDTSANKLNEKIQKAEQKTNQFIDSLVKELKLTESKESTVDEIEFKSLSFTDALKQEFAEMANLIRTEADLAKYYNHVQTFKNFVASVKKAKKESSSLIQVLVAHENPKTISAYKQMLDQACKTALETRELDVITACSYMFKADEDNIKKAKILASARIEGLRLKVAAKEKAAAAIHKDAPEKQQANLEALNANEKLSTALSNDEFKNKGYTKYDFQAAVSELALRVYRRPAHLGNMQDLDVAPGSVFKWDANNKPKKI